MTPKASAERFLQLEKQTNEILALKKSGLSFKQISDQTGLKISTACEAISKKRIEGIKRRRDFYKGLYERILPYLEKGLAVKDACKIINAHNNTVYVMLYFYNIRLHELRAKDYKPKRIGKDKKEVIEAPEFTEEKNNDVIRRAKRSSKWVMCKCKRSSMLETDLNCSVCHREEMYKLAEIGNPRHEPSLRQSFYHLGLI